jgi:hypothetical protein
VKGLALEMALSYRRLAARFGEEDERRRPGCRFLARSMPTSEYFRRQADLCLRLSLIASDEVVSTLLIAMSRDYQAKADALSQREVVAIVAQETSPDRDTHGV